MRKKIFSVTIGIPAFNEEGNIQNILNEILLQKGQKFFIREIIVISDGSTDRTIAKVKLVKDKRITLINQLKRMGKSAAIDRILKHFDSDILLLIDADTHLKNKKIFETFITHADFEKSGVVAPKFIPLDGKSNLEKALKYSVEMQNELKEKWNKGRNYLVIKGCFLGLGRKFAKSFSIPAGITNDDAYIYFKALEKGYTPQYVPQADVNYKLPTLFQEHLSQSSRFQSSQGELKNYFSQDLVKEYRVPLQYTILYAQKFFFKNPFLFIYYFYIFLLAKIKRQKQIKSIWTVAASTKKIHIKNEIIQTKGYIK